MCLLHEMEPIAQVRKAAVGVMVGNIREDEDYGGYETRRAMELMSLVDGAIVEGVATQGFEGVTRSVATGMLRRAEGYVMQTPSAGGYLSDISKLRQVYHLDPASVEV